MSEDGFSDSPDEPNMEIQIETLMGSSFDLRVSATDTVFDIKRRIHRVEGIPVTHQNLIFQSKELQDFKRLMDVGIKDRSKLKLVLSMRGGPISTRRITTFCDHQLMLKELKELLNSARDEGERLTSTSKVSLLVFKDGDMINLLRVIENEEGMYVPYSEKPISPPAKTLANHNSRAESKTALYGKLIEDNKMMSNVTTLRRKMEDATARKRGRTKGDDIDDDETSSATEVAESGGGDVAAIAFKSVYGQDSVFEMPDFKFKPRRDRFKGDFLEHLNPSMMENEDEKGEEGNLSESEENALKDKHRSKLTITPRPRPTPSLYSESKGYHSHTKHAYARMHRRNRAHHEIYHRRTSSTDSGDSPELVGTWAGVDTKNYIVEDDASALASRLGRDDDENDAKKTGCDASDDKSDGKGEGGVGKRRTMAGPKTNVGEASEMNMGDIWGGGETPLRPRLNSATYKVGLIKSRQRLNYDIDEGPPRHQPHHQHLHKPKDRLTEFDFGKPSNAAPALGVCSTVGSVGGGFYRMSPFLTSPSAIPPQYAPKNREVCDFYYRNATGGGGGARPRSPLYGRKSSRDGVVTPSDKLLRDDMNAFAKLPDIKSTSAVSTPVQDTPLSTSPADRLIGLRLQGAQSPHLVYEPPSAVLGAAAGGIEELCGIYDLGDGLFGGAETALLDLNDLGEGERRVKTSEEEKNELPPVVIKKRARCSFCNRKLNITNVYDCRCGKIFCSQHRYSEVHHCNYDYKKDGRRFLEQQNPLVTADKIHRF